MLTCFLLQKDILVPVCGKVCFGAEAYFDTKAHFGVEALFGFEAFLLFSTDAPFVDDTKTCGASKT